MADKIDISAVARVVDQATGPLRGISNAIKGIGDVAKTAGTSLANLASRGAFGGVAANVRGVGSALGNLAGNFRALASPIGAFIGIAGITGAVAAMKDFMATARQIQKVATATGATPEMVQTWRYLIGDVETADRSMTMLQKNLANFATKGGKSNRAIVDVLGKMGISMKDVRSGAIGMDEILPKLAAGFAKNTNETSRAAVGQALFGRQWAQIVPLLAKGRGGIEAAWQELQKYGYITREQIAQAGEARTAWKGMDLALAGMKNTIVAALLPAVTPLVAGFRDWLVQIKPAAAEGFRQAVTGLGQAFGFLWQGIEKVVGVMGGWGNTALALSAVFAARLIPDIFGVVTALGKLGVAAVFNPVTLAALGLAGAALVVRRNWDTVGPWLEKQFGALSPAAQQAFSAISNWAQRAYQDILKGWKSGGLVGAVSAAVWSAASAIYQNWGEITAWAGRAFPELTNAAVTAWDGITNWWRTSVRDITSAWQTGGLGAAMEATWQSMKTGATGAWQWIRDQAMAIDWAGVGTQIGNTLKAYWLAAVAGFQWLETAADWNTIGRNIGTTIGTFISTGIKALFGAETGDLQNSLVDAFKGIGRSAVYIGLEIVSGIIEGLWEGLGGKAVHDWAQGLHDQIRGFFGLAARQEAPTAESLGLPAGTRIGAAGLVKLPGQLTYGPMPSAEELERMRAQTAAAAGAVATITPAVTKSFEDAADAIAPAIEEAGAQIIPFPERKPTGPAAPLAPSTAPGVAQPSLLQQIQQLPVRLDGEVRNTLRVDMSPDLRAMLVETRTTNALLKSQVDVGQTMGPAQGEAA